MSLKMDRWNDDWSRHDFCSNHMLRCQQHCKMHWTV